MTVPNHVETRVDTLTAVILQKMCGLNKWLAEFMFENNKLTCQINITTGILAFCPYICMK